MLKKSQLFISFLVFLEMSLLLNAPVVLAKDKVSAQSQFNLLQWHHQQLPQKGSLRGSAILAQSLWVSGSKNTIFVSQDGGGTWQDKSIKSTPDLQVNNALDFRDIALFNDNTAIVMSVGNNDSRLFKTVDGGEHWRLLYQAQEKDIFFDSIAFWDENNGLLMADPIDGFYVIKRTIDGGKTWRRVAKNKLPPMQISEMAFAASGNTLIVGEQGQAWFTTGGGAASVYSSVDYGDSWQKASVPLFNDSETAGGYGLGLSHLGQVFTVGGDYKQRAKQYENMVTMIDDQWQSVDSGRYGLRSAISCQQSLCITTGKTGNDISYDAGKTWQILVNNNKDKADEGFYTLASDNGVFLFAGHDGYVSVFNMNLLK